MAKSVPSCAKRLGALVLALWLSCTTSSSAQDLFAIPESCGSGERFERELRELRDPDDVRPRPRVELTPEGERYALRVQLPEGTRVLRDKDCGSLFRAALLICALSEEEREKLMAQAPQAPEPAPPQPEQAQPAPVASAENAPGPRLSRVLSAPTQNGPRAPLVPEASVRAELAYGFVPELSLALTLGAGMSRGRFAARVEGSYLTPRSHHDGEQGVRIDALAAALSLELRVTSWLRVGAGAGMYFLHGRGVSAARTSSDWATLVAGHLGASATLRRFGRFRVELTLRGLYTADPPSFQMRGRSRVYVARHGAVQTGLGLTMQFD